MALITTEKYVKFQNSDTPNTLVNLNTIIDVAKIDIPASPLNNNTPEYQMVFTCRDLEGNVSHQIIKYSGTNTQRDSDFNAFVAATTLVI